MGAKKLRLPVLSGSDYDHPIFNAGQRSYLFFLTKEFAKRPIADLYVSQLSFIDIRGFAGGSNKA